LVVFGANITLNSGYFHMFFHKHIDAFRPVGGKSQFLWKGFAGIIFG